MKMKSFILKYASKIMFYDVNIACYHLILAFLLKLYFLGASLYASFVVKVSAPIILIIFPKMVLEFYNKMI